MSVKLNTEGKETAEAITRGVGEELRRARESLGMSRAKFVERLPSGIGDRTLLAYEHGIRQITVVRLVELSQGLEVGAPRRSSLVRDCSARGWPSRTSLFAST